MERGGRAGAPEVKALAPETQSVKKFPAPLRKKRWPGFLCTTESSSAKNFHKEDRSSEGLLEDFLLRNLCGGFFLLVKRMIRVFANFSTLCREPTRV